MKVLILSHKNDIDGLGGIILAKLAFEHVVYEVCDVENLPKYLNDFIEDESIYTFDKIFITDLWLTDPMLKEVAENKEINYKLFLFDHHRTAIEANLDRYPFTKIITADEYGKCSGTSLFYEYLLENNYLDKSAKGIYKFVELTRKYDTLEYKTRYLDDEPESLALFYNSVGYETYINLIVSKLKENDFHFSLNEDDNKVVEIKRLETRVKISGYLKTVRYNKISGYKAGIFDIDYDYRNEFAEFLREADFDADLVLMVAKDANKVSFRPLNPDVNVRMIAEGFGGRGHDFAASCPINKQIEEIIKG